MASHQIAIAKASFAASLLRPDPTSVPRSEVDQFHGLLSAVCIECSPTNVQKCKRWILSYITPSQKRIEALGKYLLALSTSFVDAPKSAQQFESATKKEVSTKRRRLHILYLIHDLVHHTKVRGGDTRVATALKPVLEGIFSLTAQGKGIKHQKKLDRLLHLWSARDYFPSSTINTLRDAVRDARSTDNNAGTADVKAAEGDKTEKTQREKPFDLPATHGDYNTAWYDLPAANLMQHIVPNSTKPIKGNLVQPLQFQPGPADAALVDAVKTLVLASKRMYGECEEDEEGKWDIDALGQRVVKDSWGTKKVEETYYGWSEEFAVRMARKKKGGLAPANLRDDRDDRAYSSDRSMSRSRSRGKSGKGNGEYGRGSFSRSTSRSRSRSRGQSIGQGRGYGGTGGRGYGGEMGSPRGRGLGSATPENMMPRGLGY